MSEPTMAEQLEALVEKNREALEAIIAEPTPGVLLSKPDTDEPLIIVRDDETVEFGNGMSQAHALRVLMCQCAVKGMTLLAASFEKALDEASSR